MWQLVSSIQDTSPGLRATGNPVNISVGERAAKNMEMLGKSVIRVNGEPIAERIRLVALQGKGSLVCTWHSSLQMPTLIPCVPRLTGS
jgi:hypothetical protein